MVQTEIRIDCANLTDDEVKHAKEETQTLFRFNHTMPFTDEHTEEFRKLFPNIGEGSRVCIPLKGVRFYNVKIGRNVVVMDGCLMMAAGGITIEDNALIAANVQLISNNHDLCKRSVITCRPIRICRNVWIGAGSTILPGVTVGENAVVGAGSVVTKDIPANEIWVGNPARFLKKVPRNNK